MALSGPRPVPRLPATWPTRILEKITAVIANMEEWRWMPRSSAEDCYILVNVPSFSIVLTDKDQTVFEERVVVGTPSTQTPIFSKT